MLFTGFGGGHVHNPVGYWTGTTSGFGLFNKIQMPLTRYRQRWACWLTTDKLTSRTPPMALC